MSLLTMLCRILDCLYDSCMYVGWNPLFMLGGGRYTDLGGACYVY